MSVALPDSLRYQYSSVPGSFNRNCAKSLFLLLNQRKDSTQSRANGMHLQQTKVVPFGETGVTALEAFLLGRKAIQNDLNPFTKSPPSQPRKGRRFKSLTPLNESQSCKRPPVRIASRNSPQRCARRI